LSFHDGFLVAGAIVLPSKCPGMGLQAKSKRARLRSLGTDPGFVDS
jgi:hypothetical protein